MGRIGIIGAMDEEVAVLKKNMHKMKATVKAGMIFAEGELWGRDSVVVVSGIGKVNMAVCAQMLIDLFDVDMLINTGVAGSLNAKIDIGDIVVSNEAQQHDMDVSALGDKVGIIPRMKDSIFKADERLVDIAYEACKYANSDINCFKGKVVSGDQFIASKDKKEFLTAYFGGMCAEMEGAAMAQVAYLNEVPFVILRAISDKADDSGHMDYPVFAKAAISHSVALLEEMYKRL
ncbi:MAG: 5'-methylthioadenosine/adenosylhomocysteine nucleosidase [Lachnospiraceae bacterium]|nr:5'-methylthioadenosine/adenosylhomocysteine nucleosidase [Lachnospiraceae bacterium]